MTAMQYSLAQQSQVGSREMNQDRIACVEGNSAVLLVLADGLGGYARGELAAETFVNSIVKTFNNASKGVITDPGTFIILSIMHAHSMINRHAKDEGITVSLPRTTGIVCLIQNGYAYWGHVGDSRLYLFRDNTVLSRTQDHTTSGQIHLDGISEEALATSEMQGHLVQAVGGPKRPIVALGQELKLKTNESILLCSDGVWKGVKSSRLPKYAAKINLDDSVDELLRQAEKNQKSDCDNISVIIFRWEGPETNAPPLYPRGLPQIDQKKLWRDTIRLSREHETVSEKDSGSHHEPSKGKKHDNLELAIEELESFIEEIDRTL